MKKLSFLRVCLFALAVLGSALPSGYPEENNIQLSDERLLLTTNYGDLVIALYPNIAPKHVNQIQSLVQNGLYDKIPFFRVMPSYLIQLAEVSYRKTPLTPVQQALVRTIPAEFSGVLHKRGSVSMAHQTGKPDSALGSFSILLADAPHLDRKYTVFGHVEKGFDVLDSIAAVELDRNSTPKNPVFIVRAKMVPASDVNKYFKSPVSQGSVDPKSSSTLNSQLRWSAAAVSVITMLGFVIFLVRYRLPPKIIGAIGLAIFLIGFFYLYTLFVPAAKEHAVLAVLIFFGGLFVFKVMGRFET